MAVGLFLRLWNLPQHGFSHYDEAHYMMEAKFWRSLAENRGELWSAWREGKLNAALVESRVDGLPPNFTPKPLHGLFIAMFSLATGLDAEWSGCLWSALVGTLTIVLVFVWCNRLWGFETAVLAAALLAVARSHVMYSRSQLAEADAIFFLMLAMVAHLSVSDGRRVPPSILKFLGVGILYGIAIGVNYRCFLVLPIIFVWDAWANRTRIRFFAAIALGIFLVAGLIELPYQLYLLKGGHLPAGMKTYFQGFYSRLMQDAPPVSAAASAAREPFLRPHLVMVRVYAWLDGLWWLGGMAIGTWVVFRGSCASARLACAMAWIPLVFFSLVPRGNGPRAVMTSIPFFVIVSAIGWRALMVRWRESPVWGRSGPIAAYGVAGVVVGLGLWGAWPETQVRSAWPAAGRFLAEQGQIVHTTYPLAARFYLRKDQGILVPEKEADPIPDGLWVIDRYNAEYAYPFESVRLIAASQKPERTFEGTVFPRTGLFLDWSVLMKRPGWREELRRPDMGHIDIYRVEPDGKSG